MFTTIGSGEAASSRSRVNSPLRSLPEQARCQSCERKEIDCARAESLGAKDGDRFVAASHHPYTAVGERRAKWGDARRIRKRRRPDRRLSRGILARLLRSCRQFAFGPEPVVESPAVLSSARAVVLVRAAGDVVRRYIRAGLGCRTCNNRCGRFSASVRFRFDCAGHRSSEDRTVE
jgi:hypothetical protein